MAGGLVLDRNWSYGWCSSGGHPEKSQLQRARRSGKLSQRMVPDSPPPFNVNEDYRIISCAPKTMKAVKHLGGISFLPFCRAVLIGTVNHQRHGWAPHQDSGAVR